jgi:hypothetical protein
MGWFSLSNLFESGANDMARIGSFTRGLMADRRAAAALEYTIIAAILAVDVTLILT